MNRALPWPLLANAMFWLMVAAGFVWLRYDPGERLYFLGDDQVVAYLVEEIHRSGHWQPDWFRARDSFHLDPYFETSFQRAAVAHDHHYSFSSHILASAALYTLLQAVGLDVPVATLLHHIALGWDTLSLLCLLGAARLLGGAPLARVTAVLYVVFPLAIQGSHYARPDALLAACGAATVWLALLRHRLPVVYWLCLHAGVLAVATLSKTSLILLGIFPALALLTGPDGRLDLSARALCRSLGLGAAMLLLTGLFMSLVMALAGMAWRDLALSTWQIMRNYRHPVPPELLENDAWHIQFGHILKYLNGTIGSPLLLAITLGALCLWRNQRQATLLLALPLCLFTIWFASYPVFFDRSYAPLASPLLLLAGFGLIALAHRLPSPRGQSLWLGLLVAGACWQPAAIAYDLATDHFRQPPQRDRHAFQKLLKETWPGFWFKQVDRADLFGQRLPPNPGKAPRIYIVEDFNDWNSRQYLTRLASNGFVQVTRFTGDFAHLPTCSLLTVHEAAHYHYFVRAEEWPADRPRPVSLPAAVRLGTGSGFAAGVGE